MLRNTYDWLLRQGGGAWTRASFHLSEKSTIGEAVTLAWDANACQNARVGGQRHLTPKPSIRRCGVAFFVLLTQETGGSNCRPTLPFSRISLRLTAAR